jgi:hypothetical protein
MADVDDDGPDFDVDLGDTGSKADKSAGKAGADEVDDELEDLSREELYDRLKEANGTAKKYRLRLKRARSGAGRTSDRDDEDDDRGSRRRASGRERDDRDDDREDDDDRGSRRRSSRADELEERAIRAEAKTYLAAAGIPADRLGRAVRLIDLKSLELDGEDLLGIDEEIEDLKDEWPELFKRSRSSRDDDDDDRDSRRDSGTRRRVSRADTRAGGGTGGRDRGNKKKTSTEIAAEQLMGLANR